MNIKPADQERILKERVEFHVEQAKAWLKQALEEGFGPFGKRPPRERLPDYESVTLPEDRPLVLDPEYLAKRRAGLAPLLLAEQLLSVYELAMVEHEMMMTQGVTEMEHPPPQKPPDFWVLALSLPDEAWEFFTGDFRTLLREQEKLQEQIIG